MGMQIHHNFIRPHMALGGKIPSQVAGVIIEGENKCLTMIQNAAHGPRIHNEQRTGRPIDES
jgi:hypothetical protein